MPERMPPRMITIVIRPQIASTAILSAWRGGTISPLGKFSRCAMTRTSAISERPSRSAGMIPPMKSWATDTVPPAASE